MEPLTDVFVIYKPAPHPQHHVELRRSQLREQLLGVCREGLPVFGR